MNINSLDINLYIPHNGKMSLLDELVDSGENWIKARVTIRPDMLFYDVKGIPAVVGIEYMAQTIAAYAGKLEIDQGLNPKIGLLLGTRKYQSNLPYFSLGSELIIYAQEEYNDDSGLGMFSCTIQSTDNKISVSATINVFYPKDIGNYFDNNDQQ